MKIGFDISPLTYQGSGVATYTYNLVKHLLIYDTKNEYRLFYSSFRRPPHFYYLEELKKLGGKIYDYPFPPRLLKFWWNTTHMFPVEWFIGKVDIYHSSDFLRPPLSKTTKGITTIHDLTWKKFPLFHTSDIVKAHERKLEKTILYADDIIVDSHNTRTDLLGCYPHVEKTNRIFVIYPGIDKKFIPIKNRDKIRQTLKKYDLIFPKKYLLYVGAIEPRKNLNRAITMFSEFIKDPLYDDYEFLLVGRAGWKNESTFSLIHTLHLQEKVRFVGYVLDEDLPYFYNASRVLIYLSAYEGFGLPPLEAARCGIPALIYKNSSLKEMFPNTYPFASEGRELDTLLYILTTAYFINPKLLKRYEWYTTSSQFMKLY